MLDIRDSIFDIIQIVTIVVLIVVTVAVAMYSVLTAFGLIAFLVRLGVTHFGLLIVLGSCFVDTSFCSSTLPWFASDLFYCALKLFFGALKMS